MREGITEAQVQTAWNRLVRAGRMGESDPLYARELADAAWQWVTVMACALHQTTYVKEFAARASPGGPKGETNG